MFYYTKFTFFKYLHGTCCHFSLINNASERRNCVYIPNSEALLSNLDDVKSPCIINMKTSAIFKVGILQCITVTLSFSQIIIRFVVFTLYCNFINTLYKIMA